MRNLHHLQKYRSFLHDRACPVMQKTPEVNDPKTLPFESVPLTRKMVHRLGTGIRPFVRAFVYRFGKKVHTLGNHLIWRSMIWEKVRKKNWRS